MFDRRFVLSAVLLLSACGDDETPARPWYDLAPLNDSTILRGDVEFSVDTLAIEDPRAGAMPTDLYLPKVERAPLVIFLPGAGVAKERYRWVGVTLASHGFAAAIVQPSGLFATARHVLRPLEVLAERNARDPRLDLGRVLLGGHSAGGLASVGLTDLAACNPAFCAEGDQLPSSVRGLVLFGYHNQVPVEASDPMRAAELAWLLISGDRDGLATPERVARTFARIKDRPRYQVVVSGMNHFQFTDYVVPEKDTKLDDDGLPALDNAAARRVAAEYLIRFSRKYLLGADVPGDLGADGDGRVRAEVEPARLHPLGPSTLPKVSARLVGPAGLDGRSGNVDVSASAEYRGQRYLLVRNGESGAEIFRLNPDGLAERVFAPAENGSTARLDGRFGAMAVFRDQLFVGISSGGQGTARDSTGAEVWRFDGTDWTAVVARTVDADPELRFVRCSEDATSGTLTLELAEGGQAPDLYAGSVLDDVGAQAEPRIFDVLESDATTLTVAENAVVVEARAEPSRCDPALTEHGFFVRRGLDESGFGQSWNKAILGMAVFGDRLYVATALNLKAGAEIYASADGQTFAPAVERAFFGQHPGGAPISSSISALATVTVAGKTALYFGTTGTQGYGARLGVLETDAAPRWLIDDRVDENDSGLDEAGMGHANYQVLSLVGYQDRLYLGAFNLGGFELLSSPDPLAAGAEWTTQIGQDAPVPAGLGDRTVAGVRLSVQGDQLWLLGEAVIVNAQELAEKSAIVLRTRDAKEWQLVSGHAFGSNAVSVSQLFALDGSLYATTGRGALNQRTGFLPLELYRLSELNEGDLP